MAKADGGPAFPADARIDPVRPSSGILIPGSQGMSLRDWFAGQALLGLVQRHPADARVPVEIRAYAIADAMLAARGGSDDQ